MLEGFRKRFQEVESILRELTSMVDQGVAAGFTPVATKNFNRDFYRMIQENCDDIKRAQEPEVIVESLKNPEVKYREAVLQSDREGVSVLAEQLAAKILLCEVAATPSPQEIKEVPKNISGGEILSVSAKSLAAEKLLPSIEVNLPPIQEAEAQMAEELEESGVEETKNCEKPSAIFSTNDQFGQESRDQEGHKPGDQQDEKPEDSSSKEPDHQGSEEISDQCDGVNVSVSANDLAAEIVLPCVNATNNHSDNVLISVSANTLAAGMIVPSGTSLTLSQDEAEEQKVVKVQEMVSRPKMFHSKQPKQQHQWKIWEVGLCSNVVTDEWLVDSSRFQFTLVLLRAGIFGEIGMRHNTNSPKLKRIGRRKKPPDKGSQSGCSRQGVKKNGAWKGFKFRRKLKGIIQLEDEERKQSNLFARPVQKTRLHRRGFKSRKKKKNFMYWIFNWKKPGGKDADNRSHRLSEWKETTQPSKCNYLKHSHNK
jgi:hypothetical protein